MPFLPVISINMILRWGGWSDKRQIKERCCKSSWRCNASWIYIEHVWECKITRKGCEERRKWKENLNSTGCQGPHCTSGLCNLNCPPYSLQVWLPVPMVSFATVQPQTRMQEKEVLGKLCQRLLPHVLRNCMQVVVLGPWLSEAAGRGCQRRLLRKGLQTRYQGWWRRSALDGTCASSSQQSALLLLGCATSQVDPCTGSHTAPRRNVGVVFNASNPTA